MNIADYISQISFRFIEPFIPLTKELFDRIIHPLGKLGFSLSEIEIANTKLPYGEGEMRNRLYELCNIPKMSTYAIGAIINMIVSQLKDGQAFVNVGVWHGFTFLAGIKENADKKCIGIDNFSEFTNTEFGDPRKNFLERFSKYRSHNHYFYEMDYIEYFSKVHNEFIGFYIYDGSHTYEDQLMGLRIAEPFFVEGCIILIDDTNVPIVRSATQEFISKSSNKYQIIADKNTAHNGHPTFWNGIMVLQKIK